MSSDELYELALKELKEHRPVAAVWARALAESEGDKNKAVARYIKHRVEQVTESFSQAEAVTPKPAVAPASSGPTATAAMQPRFDAAYGSAGHAVPPPVPGQGQPLGFEMTPPSPPAVPRPPVPASGWGAPAGTVSADAAPPVPPMAPTPPVPAVPSPAPVAGPHTGISMPPSPPVQPPSPPAPYAAQPDTGNPYSVMPAAQVMGGGSFYDDERVLGLGAASHRAVARWFDYFLISIPVILTIKSIGLGIQFFIPESLHQYMTLISQSVTILIATPIILAIEAIIYALFGNTPSKAILCIELYRDGQRLNGADYLRRNISVWAWAYACGIGCLSFPLQIVHCVMASSVSGQTLYDQRLDVDVVCRPLDPGRTILGVLMFIVAAFGSMLL